MNRNRTFAAVSSTILFAAVLTTGTGAALADTCTLPPTADDNVLVTIKHVVDAAAPSDSRVRLATYEAAWVESHANDLPCGDSDSIGVFQQRPSTGWTHAGDPELATHDFLYGNPSDNTLGAIAYAAAHPSLSAGLVADGVQHSQYPSRYDGAESTANALIARASQLDTWRETGQVLVSDAAGRMWAFAVRQDTHLWYRYTGSSGWGAWQTAAGTGYRSVSASVDGTGRVLTAVTMTTGDLKYRRTVDPQTVADPHDSWGSWSAPMGAGDWANVSVSTDSHGQVWIFATKTYGSLYYRHQDGGDGPWLSFLEVPKQNSKDWKSVSTTVTGNSSTNDPNDSRVWMFATTQNGDLWYRHTGSSGWDGWQQVSGYDWAGDVAAVADTASTVWLFASTAKGSIVFHHTTSTGWETAWHTAASTGWSGVAAEVKPDSGSGQIWMLGSQVDGDLSYRHTDSSADGWQAWSQFDPSGGFK